jgi:amino acid transporter
MISALITLIVYLLILGILIWLVYYVVDAIPLPEPINRIVKLAVVVVCALIVIVLLLNLLGAGVNIDLPKIG